MVHEGEKEAESLDSVPLVEMYMCGTYALQNLLHLLTYFYPPPDILWKRRQFHRTLRALSQGTGWLNWKPSSLASGPDSSTTVHCWKSPLEREPLPLPGFLSLVPTIQCSYFLKHSISPCGTVNKYNTSKKELQIFMAVITSHPKKGHGSDH